MPTFFQFQQGNESRSRLPVHDTSPLLGRFRAVPPRPGVRRRSSQLGLLADASRGSVHIGYGAAAVIAAGLEDSSDDEDSDSDSDDSLFDDDDDERHWRARRWVRNWRRWVTDVWVEPKQAAVKRIVGRWWTRYGTLVFLPALLAVAWCAIPLPKYPIPDEDLPEGGKIPGHGAAQAQLNFWFFLFIYYGFYNVTALIWITKVFNLYSLNWWPATLGFPLTISLIAIFSIALPIPVYFSPDFRWLIDHNTTWISWTFIVMAVPVMVAFLILMFNERHIRSRTSLSETQRIFTSSWFTGDDTLSRRESAWTRRQLNVHSNSTSLDSNEVPGPVPGRQSAVSLRHRWLPASFVRFLWFCVALFIGLMAYVIGEAYAEIYLRTLPHNSLETVVYVYGWVTTIHLLDALTGWVLGIKEGERVGSYPLSWVFKLYFMLTYQTYVRALYARLRSPSQFVILQILSSTSLVIITPIMMTSLVHRILTVLGMNGQSYASYQKLQARNVFIRFLAENASMVTFLGSVLVLHHGPNRDVYPYFAFDEVASGGEEYDFNLTFWASGVTWACELIASLAVRGLIRVCFKVDVGLEGKLDLVVWPELLPTCVVVMVHVLQNMLFSIIRLQFR